MSGRGCRPTSSTPTARAACRPRRRTSAPTCGARVVAQRLGFIGKRELGRRLERTLVRRAPGAPAEHGGQFYNWYDHRTGAKLTAWPPTGAPLTPILSSVDNGWLAVGLRIVENSRAEAAASRGRAVRVDELRFLLPARRQSDPVPLRPGHGRGAVLLRHRRQREPDRRLHRDRAWADAAEGVLRPLALVPGHLRLEVAGDEAGRPVTRTYFGVDVFEGAYPYAGMLVTPSWGGAMFEALMPDLFVPEERWAPRWWGVNHPLTVRAQIHHGLNEAGYGVLGLLALQHARGRLRGLRRRRDRHRPGRRAVQQGQDAGRPRLRRAAPAAPLPDPPPSAYTNGVVTPHAAFLGLRYAPESHAAQPAPSCSATSRASTPSGASGTP